MQCSNFTLKAVIAAQFLAAGSLHAGGLADREQSIIYLDDGIAHGSINQNERLVDQQLVENGLLLSISEPNSALQTSLAELRCTGDGELQNIDLKAFDEAGDVVQHAELFLGKTDQDIVVGNGSIYETKIDHGVIVIDDSVGHVSCDPLLNQWTVHISATAPIRHLLITPVPLGTRGPAETKIDHGVLLIDD